MAVRSSEQDLAVVGSSLARTAAVVCAILALVPAGGLVWFLWAHPVQGTGIQAYLVGWIVVFFLVAATSARLVRGSMGGASRRNLSRRGSLAQQFLLVFWLLAAMASLLALLAASLWGFDWWPAPVSLPVVAVPMLVIALIAAVLLVLWSAERSRLRYASYVTVSVAAALGLVIVFNMIAQTEYYRRDVETLGRYGLSERTRRILQTLKAPVRLTCVYTSTDEKTRASDYRPAVLELLEEMRQAGSRVEVANAATDSAKVRVVARLRGQLGSQVEQHTAFLREFHQRTEPLIKAVQAEQQMWKALGEDSYVGMWGLPGEVIGVLGKTSQEIERLRSRIAREMAASALPDFAGIVDETVRALSGDRDTFGARADQLERIAKIPQAASGNKAAALEALDQCARAIEVMTETTRASTQAANQSEALVKFIVSARTAIQKTLAAAKALENVAGSANAEMVRESRRFQLTVPSGVFEVRTDVATFLEKDVAESLENISRELEGIKKVAKPEYYGQGIKEMERLAKDIDGVVRQVKEGAGKAVEALTTVDEPSDRILKAAAQKGAFKGVLDLLRPLVADAQKLPPLESNALTKDIVSDNIVIVEAGGGAGVVRFDEAWPLKSRGAGAAEGVEAKEQRIFNGDSAVSSKILGMTAEPFATVLLTYFAPSPDAARVLPPAEIAAEELTALRKRLEEANFEVRDWNLSEAMPLENPDRPAVLLVLPPPPSVPIPPRAPAGWKSFSQEHVAKVRQAIDSGVPAIFVAQFQPPRQLGMYMPPIQPPYGFGEYLVKEWGIEVKTDYLVVPAVPDEVLPGRYKVDSQRFTYLPLSAFSDHAIGLPLQAQRVLWAWLSPIVKTGPLRGVTVWPLLTVPSNWRSTWATNRLKELVSQFQTREGSYIWPDYPAGDIAAPFDVAVAADRSGESAASSPATASAPAGKRARIVVMTLGAALIDGYLDQRVGQLDSKGTLSLADPPLADADVVVNSVYWLIGRERYIAAGPVQVKPVELISTNALAWIRWLCLAGLPLAVATIGGAVMLVRRR
jgi:hypothetical protein